MSPGAAEAVGPQDHAAWSALKRAAASPRSLAFRAALMTTTVALVVRETPWASASSASRWTSAKSRSMKRALSSISYVRGSGLMPMPRAVSKTSIMRPESKRLPSDSRRSLTGPASPLQAPFLRKPLSSEMMKVVSFLKRCIDSTTRARGSAGAFGHLFAALQHRSTSRWLPPSNARLRLLHSCSPERASPARALFSVRPWTSSSFPFALPNFFGAFVMGLPKSRKWAMSAATKRKSSYRVESRKLHTFPSWSTSRPTGSEAAAVDMLLGRYDMKFTPQVMPGFAERGGLWWGQEMRR